MENNDSTVTKPIREKIGVGSWLGTLALSAIPVVNLVFWIVWAAKAKCAARRGFAIANIIFLALFIALAVVGVTVFGTQLLDWARSINPNLFTDLLVEG